MARLNADGTPDRAFGSGRRVITDLGLGPDRFAAADDVLVQPDGKIVAVGLAQVEPLQGYDRFALVRYLPDGRLDPSFGTGGIVVVGHLQASMFGSRNAVALQGSGSIVVAGGIAADEDPARRPCCGSPSAARSTPLRHGRCGHLRPTPEQDYFRDVVTAGNRLVLIGATFEREPAADFLARLNGQSGALDRAFGSGRDRRAARRLLRGEDPHRHTRPEDRGHRHRPGALQRSYEGGGPALPRLTRSPPSNSLSRLP